MLINHESVEYIFFFNDTATTEIYTLSLHDALPIFSRCRSATRSREGFFGVEVRRRRWGSGSAMICRFIYAVRSEEHTSELQSRQYLVCRLLLEKKKINDLLALRALVDTFTLHPSIY